ncbi:MAG: argininosuccinate synthase [Planctomycetota bacterium]
MAKVVVAYSGGLDTSLAIHWLQHRKNFKVITFTADIGQGGYLEPVGEQALAMGVERAMVTDLREKFVTEYIFPALRAGAVYESGYFLASALSRPLIASEIVTIAVEEGCEYVAHGAAVKGNDIIRFETAIAALAPNLKIIVPAREWSFKSRDEMIEYASKNGIPGSVTREFPYSIDRNLWGASIGEGALADAGAEPPDDTYLTVSHPSRTPDEAETIEIGFEEGRPVTIDGEAMPPVKLVELLHKLGSRHGVGRTDIIEDRTTGIKSREIYEAPAATILHKAHRALEEMVLPKGLFQFKCHVAQRYAELVYDGKWFSEFRGALDAFVACTQRFVTGAVRVKLFKAVAGVAGRRSEFSLYDPHLASQGACGGFDERVATDYLKVLNLPVRHVALRNARLGDTVRPVGGGGESERGGS